MEDYSGYLAKYLQMGAVRAENTRLLRRFVGFILDMVGIDMSINVVS